MNYEQEIIDYLTDNYYPKMAASVAAKKKFNTKKLLKEISEKFGICMSESVDNVYDWVDANFNEDERDYL